MKVEKNTSTDSLRGGKDEFKKRKKKKEIIPGEEKKKQNPSCDACRARKVRCERDPPLDPLFNVYAPGAIIPACKHCSGLKIVCSYFYQPRKRGPPNLYLKKLKSEAAEAELAGTSGGGAFALPFPQVQPTPESVSESSTSTTSPPNPNLAGYTPATSSSYQDQQLQQQQYYQPDASDPRSYLPPLHYDHNGYLIDQDSNRQHLDEDDDSTGPSQGPQIDQSSGQGWNFPPPPSSGRPYDGMPPPQQLSMSASTSSNSRPVSFSALTLPKVSPSPPISPGLASSSIAAYPRYDLTTFPPSSLSSGGSRSMLPSIIRPSPLSSPSANTNFPLQSASTPGPYGMAGNGYAQPPLHAPSPPFYGAMSSTSYERNSARWGEGDANGGGATLDVGAGGNAQAGPSGSSALMHPGNGMMVDVVPSPANSNSSRIHRIEDVLPRDTCVYIISLFFDYVWPLTPCLHRPTFLADLNSHLEERNPLFFAVVMSTLACTLVQVPKSYIPVEANQVRKLAARCFAASRAISVESYDPPVLEMVIIRYFDTVYHFVIGNPGSNHAAYGECQHIAISLGLHKEDSYQGLDPIETEIRRRIFFLVVIADKSMVALSGRPIAMRPEDYWDVLPPAELDDEFITREGYLSQPLTRTAIIVGFNIIARIFAVLGEIVSLQRETRRVPPVGPEAIVRKLREVGALMNKTVKLLEDSPPAFSMKKSFNSAANSPAAGWETEARSGLNTYFFEPALSKETAKDAYLVSQGNIFITHALTRFLLLQYRDELLELSGELGTPSRTAAERVSWDADEASDRREAVAVDLLNVLHNIPIQSLAVNGPSLVHKVRFVASTLLDLDPDPPAVKGEQSVMRINAYLWDFLSILSEIEKNFAD